MHAAADMLAPQTLVHPRTLATNAPASLAARSQHAAVCATAAWGHQVPGRPPYGAHSSTTSRSCSHGSVTCGNNTRRPFGAQAVPGVAARTGGRGSSSSGGGQGTPRAESPGKLAVCMGANVRLASLKSGVCGLRNLRPHNTLDPPPPQEQALMQQVMNYQHTVRAQRSCRLCCVHTSDSEQGVCLPPPHAC
jgi:hypothetical protein